MELGHDVPAVPEIPDPSCLVLQALLPLRRTIRSLDHLVVETWQAFGDNVLRCQEFHGNADWMLSLTSCQSIRRRGMWYRADNIATRFH